MFHFVSLWLNAGHCPTFNFRGGVVTSRDDVTSRAEFFFVPET